MVEKWNKKEREGRDEKRSIAVRIGALNKPTHTRRHRANKDSKTNKAARNISPSPGDVYELSWPHNCLNARLRWTRRGCMRYRHQTEGDEYDEAKREQEKQKNGVLHQFTTIDRYRQL